MKPGSPTLKSAPPKLVVIGASAGGLEALNSILPALSGRFPAPVVVVVHLPAGKESALPSIFGERCSLRVKEAEDKERLEPGVVYFAPPDYHLLVETGGTLSLSSEEPELFSRPSINVLFESAADACGSGVVGIILSGANSDGADGLRAVCAAGGRAMVQEPETAASEAMPNSAARACPRALLLKPGEIAKRLMEMAGTTTK